MRIDRFTQKAHEAVHEAQHLAQEYNHPAIEPEHLLKVLIEQEGGVIPSVLNRIGANWRLVVTIGLACTFNTYKMMPGGTSQMSIKSVYDREYALQVVAAAMEDYGEAYGV